MKKKILKAYLRWYARATHRLGIQHYVPNTSTQMALMSIPDYEEHRRARAFWPMRLTQIVGGKRWSISVIVHTTPKPTVTPEERERIKEGIYRQRTAERLRERP